jgi:hypothetical protein
MNRYFIRPAIVAGLAGLLVTSAAVRIAADATSTIYVTVAKDDKAVPNLTARSFQILAGGQMLPVVTAEPARDPLSLVLFVQTRADDGGLSGANETSLTRTAVRNVLAQIRQVNPEARVGLVTSAAGPNFVGVTSQAVLLERQIGTLVRDDNIGSIVERIPGLAHDLEQEPNRRRIILSITPPGVTRGVQLSKDTAPALQRCGCELWGLIIAETGGTLLDRDDVFTNLISVSGGRRANVFGVPLLDAQAKTMTSLLLSQYKVTFQHPDTKSPLALRVGVQSAVTGLQVYAPGWTVN